MMALVPWRDRSGGQHCQLHVVEKTTTNDVDDNIDAGASATARGVALEALGDRPDFCICMIDPRSESSVEFAKAAIDTLLNASVDDDNVTPLSRPNICALINYMDSIKIVDDEELGEAGDNEGLFRMTQSRLLDICADIMSMQSTGDASQDADKNVATTTIPPSIQIYPSSMVSCSGLSSLHSFIMLPFMRKNEVRMLQQVDMLRRNHNKSMVNLRDGGVKAMQEAIDEGKARMSTAPPINSDRRSIIQRKKAQGIRNGSGPTRQSAATASGWEKRRVRIDESRNTNHFEGDEALPTESAAAFVRQENIDEMTARLQDADQARRRRRQRALDGVKTGEEGPKRTSGKEESSGRSRRSIISSKQRHTMSETISKLPTASSKRIKQPRKQTKGVTDDPMKALEDFLGSDSDSDSGGDPLRSGVEGADSDNDSSSRGNDSTTSTDDDEGPRHSILLSDSDSEDDYYDQEGHANYSHLDYGKKPAAKKQVNENPPLERVESAAAKKHVDENPPSERVESVAEEVPVDSVDTPEKRDSKTPRSDHDEEEKKDESPSGRRTGTADDQSKPSPSLNDDDGEKAVDTEEGGGESTERHEILVLDSEDESVDNHRPEILHSDDESSAGKDFGAGSNPNASPPVEILHSDDDDDDGSPSPAPLPERSPAVNDFVDEDDDVSDSEPPVASSSSNILVEALEAEVTADEPKPVGVSKPEKSKTLSEDPTSTGMSAAVAAALAAAEEDARRMMLEAVSPEKTKKKRSKAKKKKKRTGEKEKKKVKKSDRGYAS